jgi:hypothetical protein
MRLMVGCLLAMAIATAQGAEKNPWAWEMKSLGRGCEISAFARSDADNYMLFISWTSDRGYELRAWGGKADSMLIETVGAPVSFTVAPVNLYHLLKGGDVQALSTQLAGGRPVRLTVKPHDGQPQVFTTPTANAAQAAAALDACVDMLKASPVPGSERTDRGFYVAVGTSEGCDLERFWHTQEGAFTITLKAAAQGAAVEFARVIGSHSAFPTKPFTVDARNFHGAATSEMRSVRVELSAVQLAQLESELLAGKARTAELAIPDAAAETLTFGSPLTRAPAAMFASCRRWLAPPQAAVN